MNGNFTNIPLELRLLKQWVCWREGKIPFQPNGQLASVIEQSTWNDFNTCMLALANPLNLGIGFVFSENDPYAFIDLDNAHGDQVILATHLRIAHEFNSYSEVSPSGMGLHIIIKGRITAGRRRSKVEIYSSQRYATMTGNIHNATTINDYQAQITMLWEQMGSGPVAQTLYKGDDKELYSDEEIVKRATDSINGDKFVKLLSGEWNDYYTSQSEADFAFIDIVAFYTQNKLQITRIFRSSALGKRDKALRSDYTQGMINRSFDRMLPNIDIDGFQNALEAKLAQDQLSLPLVAVSVNGKPTAFDAVNIGSSPVAAANGSVAQQLVPAASAASTNPPPGLLGEIAHFIYNQAPRPVPEIALAGAIGLMAGIVGRAYNVNGTGLNQYVLVLAKTGRGKEAAALGIDKLMNAVKMQVPTSTGFRGPGDINSGQALVKYLHHTSRCFVSVIGEFGITIDRISQPYANSADKMLYKLLLDLYNKSGFGQTVQASIYSKKEDSVGATEAPAVTILGESTHKLFYGALTEDMIAAGLLPRFLIIDYDGDRVPNNENAYLVQPSFSLIEKFASLIAQCEITMSANRVINVNYTQEAFEQLKKFDKLADVKINSARDDVVAELWNRAHMKALRLAALIAVGVNMIEPTITIEYVEWAIDLVQTDIKILSSRFESGEIGNSSNELKQTKEIIRIIKEYVSSDYSKVEKYMQTKSQPLHKDKIIPYVYLNKRLASASVFRLDKAGATIAMKRAIQNLVDNDRVKELGKVWANEKYGTSQRCFIVADTSILD